MDVNRHFSTVLWIGLALAGCASPSLASAADTTPPALAAERPSRTDFSGHWILNAKASDDPQEKAREAMKAMQQEKGGGRGMGGQGRGGGMGGGHQGRGPSGGMSGRGEMPSRELSTLMAPSEKLDITHEDPMLLITDENDQRQRIFTDLRGASVSASGGLQQRVSFAGWEGATLVVETTMAGGSRLVQNYQIDSATGQLMIVAAANLPDKKAVSYRLVYDRLKPGVDAGR